MLLLFFEKKIAVKCQDFCILNQSGFFGEWNQNPRRKYSYQFPRLYNKNILRNEANVNKLSYKIILLDQNTNTYQNLK